MPGQYIQKNQVQVYMRAREKGCTQPEAAYIAGFSERSGRRIETGTHQPKYGGAREWRTRPDPLEQVWESELEPMLHRDPRLEPTTLYEYVVEKYPGQYESTLRTLQRRVDEWKVLHGAPKEVMFPLRHEPGVMGLSDFTTLSGVEITIGGKPFQHLLYHYRLAYSGWEYVQPIQGGESFIALSEGLQNALNACGGVPKEHRTDSLTAAYRNAGGKKHKQLTRFYQELCAHYRMEPTRNSTGVAHQNGSIESPHGHFKRRLVQQIYLRGSADFESVAEYQALIHQVVTKLNGKRTQKFEAEKQHLQPLPQYRFADYEELQVKVSCHSTIEVRCVLYTVPSQLIGRLLAVHLYHDRLLGYVGKQQVLELPRLRGANHGTQRRAHCINYRHIIDGLRRKPRAFLYCTWQQELLPTEQWRQVWQLMAEQFEPDSAARVMVEALYIAALQDKETAVCNYLEAQLRSGSLTLVGLQQFFQLLPPTSVPEIDVQQHSLSSYDQLIGSTSSAPSFPTNAESEQPLSQPEPAAQTTPLVPHAQPLANHRSQSPASELVLRTVLAGTVPIRGRQKAGSETTTGSIRSSAPRRQKFYDL